MVVLAQLQHIQRINLYLVNVAVVPKHGNKSGHLGVHVLIFRVEN